MTEVALSLAVKKLGDLLIEKVSFLQDVEEKVRWLRSELKGMHCFLKDASMKQANDERIRNWISEIREVAQDAEDTMDIFILKVDTPRSNRGLLGTLACFPRHVYHVNSVGEEIERIRTKLQEIERRRQVYKIENLGQRMNGQVDWRRKQFSPWQKDKDVVGLERDVESLLRNAILNESEGLIVASIVGMCGIGKSTLARKLYNHTAVTHGPFDRRAWAVLSGNFRPRDVIKQLTLQLLEPHEDKLHVANTVDALPLIIVYQMFHERLRNKRHFIVLDDVWERAHWEVINSCLPEGTRNRLLLTSRIDRIANRDCYVHRMKNLDIGNSWKLFMKAVKNNDDLFPCVFKSIGTEIVRKCDGLPLAINVVGGLLVDTNAPINMWENVLNELKYHLATRGSVLSGIMDLGYSNLSLQLKSCFLHLGFFREDATIRAKKLVQVWVAQGLIEEAGGQTMEEIGRGYLDELINRSMVQVKDLKKDETVKSCGIHDLLRDLAITKANEEISFQILKEDWYSESLRKPRHLAIYSSEESFIYSAGKNKHNYKQHLRSLFFYGSHGDTINVNGFDWKNIELLRVLDFEDFKLKNLPDTIGELIGLRYLGLRNSCIEKLPRSLGRLKRLEVLDIAKNGHVDVPNVLWKMDSLRHVYMSHHVRFSPLLKIKTLKNLQTLAYINFSDFIPNHLKHVTGLRKLGIYLGLSTFRVNDFDNSLKNLVCLSLRETMVCLPSVDGLSALSRLTQLKLHGIITKLPSADDFPPNLSYLTLVESHFDEDPMPVLEKLPNLLHLKLDSAYDGEEMVISNEGFPKLKVLILRTLMGLKTIRAGKRLYGGKRPSERLEIYECNFLNPPPEELRTITIMLKE